MFAGQACFCSSTAMRAWLLAAFTAYACLMPDGDLPGSHVDSTTRTQHSTCTAPVDLRPAHVAHFFVAYPLARILAATCCSKHARVVLLVGWLVGLVHRKISSSPQPPLSCWVHSREALLVPHTHTTASPQHAPLLMCILLRFCAAPSWCP